MVADARKASDSGPVPMPITASLKASRALGERLLAASREKDFDAVRACYHPDATLFTAATGVTCGFDQHYANLKAKTARIATVGYEDVRITATETGYIQQHFATGTFVDGTGFRVGACWVCQIEDGLIRNHDYYVDSILYS